MEETQTIDARGFSCPEPALLVRRALRSKTQGVVRVLVDSISARDNVTRLAQKMDWQIVITAGSNDEGFLIELTK